MKRAYKLQDFIAHAGPVNCLTIGRKSSGVMVTGGEDKKVNMWAIGKPSAILSLSGLQSPVESVTFDCAEENVVAGAANGTIKLWDLEEAKVVRTLTGHRSGCVAVDFHPFGEFFASGSQDTNVKVWDLRHKGCIQTYKGHTGAVSQVRFSPDGRWLVSGGADSKVKLWDLTAGKQLVELKQHDGPIRAIEFHPSEFLLATGSQDRWIKLWDLESFDPVDSMGPDSTAVQALAFLPSGSSLVGACPDHVKVWGWEPCRAEDYVDVSWSSKVADIAVHEQRLLGCTLRDSSVSVWVVDLNHYPPPPPKEPLPASSPGKALSRHPAGSPPRLCPKTPTPGQMQLRQDDNTAAAPRHTQTAAAPAPRPSHPYPLAPSTAAPQGQQSRPMLDNNIPIQGHRATTGGAPARRAAPLEPALKDYGRDGAGTSEPSDGFPVKRPSGSAGRRRPSPSDGSSVRVDSAVDHQRHHAPPAAGPFQPEWEVHAPTSAPSPPPPLSAPLASDHSPQIPPSSSSSGNTKVTIGTEMGESMQNFDGPFPPELLRAAARALAEQKEVADDDAAVPDLSVLRIQQEGEEEEDGKMISSHHGQEHAHICKDPLGQRLVLKRDSMLKPEEDEEEEGRVVPQLPPDSRLADPDVGPMRRVPSAGRREGTPVGEARRDVPAPGGGGDVTPEVQIPSRREHEARGGPAPSEAPHTKSPHTPGGPMGLDFAAFVPKSPSVSASDRSSEGEALDRMLGPHGTVSGILCGRLTSLQAVRMHWARGDARGALKAMEKVRDASVLVDFLEASEDCPDALTLETSAGLAPMLSELLDSEHSKYVLTAMRTAKAIATAFGDLIRSTRAVSASPGVGIDLNAETRLERCNSCHRHLCELSTRLEVLSKRGGDVSARAKDLLMAFDALGP